MSLEEVQKKVALLEKEASEEVIKEIKKVFPIGTVFKYNMGKYIVLDYEDEEIVKLYNISSKSKITANIETLNKSSEILYTIDTKWLEQFKMTL